MLALSSRWQCWQCFYLDVAWGQEDLCMSSLLRRPSLSAWILTLPSSLWCRWTLLDSISSSISSIWDFILQQMWQLSAYVFNAFCLSVMPMINPLRRDNPPSFMTRGIAGSQVTLCGEWPMIPLVLCSYLIKVDSVNWSLNSPFQIPRMWRVTCCPFRKRCSTWGGSFSMERT